MDLGLAGKTVLITGAAGGVGRASDLVAYVTGQELSVDGGQMSGLGY